MDCPLSIASGQLGNGPNSTITSLPFPDPVAAEIPPCRNSGHVQEGYPRNGPDWDKISNLFWNASRFLKKIWVTCLESPLCDLAFLGATTTPVII